MNRVLLIVEDNKAVMDLYASAFEMGEFNVEKAFNGEEALEILKKGEKPEVILLDIMMPKMNGFEFLMKLREDEELQDVPVVILSNLAQQHDVDKGLKLGAALYLVKSQYEPEDIVKMVDTVIKRQKDEK